MAKKKQEEELTPEEETVETPVEEAVAEVDPWEEKYNAEHDSYLRLAADYDNFRKRSQKEKEQSYGNGKANAVEKLLPVYDNLERALNQETADEAYKKGVEMIYQNFTEILKKLGAEAFGEKGEQFDPNFHNGVMHVEDDSFGENEIAEVFSKGYKLGDRVLRPAMVKVVN